MQAQLNRLETLLARTLVTDKDPSVIIQHVHIDHPKLDQLTFRLDDIEIDQLSGQLNIGTNSGIIPPAGASPNHKKTNTRIKKNPAESGLSPTPTGFRHVPKK